LALDVQTYGNLVPRVPVAVLGKSARTFRWDLKLDGEIAPLTLDHPKEVQEVRRSLADGHDQSPLQKLPQEPDYIQERRFSTRIRAYQDLEVPDLLADVSKTAIS